MNKIHKCIYRKTEREKERKRKKESEKVGQSSSKKLWKFQVNEKSSGGRVFLVKYIYIYIRFLTYEISLWKLKLVSTICIFVIKLRLLNNHEKCFLFYQKRFCPGEFQILYSPLFSFLGHCWFYRRSWFMINSQVYGIIMSQNWILKTDSFHRKIWLSQY